MEILTLLKANIRHRKGTFISILILMLIIVTAMTAIFNASDNGNLAVEQALQRVHSGDLIVYINESAYTEELQASLLEQDSVDKVVPVPAFWTESSEANGKKSHETAFLRTLTPDYQILNETQTEYEPETPPLNPGEIYVPLGVQAKHPCAIGDTIHYTTTFGEYDFVVKGFIEEPNNGGSMMGWKQIFVSDSDFAQMEQDYGKLYTKEENMGTMYILHIFKSPDCTVSDATWKQELNLETGIIDIAAMGSLTKAQVLHYTGLFNTIISNILMVFLCLLFVIVLIIISHSLSSSIEADYINLGILKAQGFTTGKLQAVLLLQYLSAEVAGAALGLILAIPLTAALVRLYLPITAILADHTVSLNKSLICILVLLLLSTVILLCLTQKVGKLSPVRALSAGQADQYFDSRFHFAITQKLLTGSLALRQFTSASRRYLSSILVAAILVFFMLTITVLANMANSKAALESMGYIYSDLIIYFQEPASDSQIEDIEAEITLHSPINKAYYLTNQYISIDGYEIYCFVFRDPEIIAGITRGRAPLYSNEVLITDIVASELDLDIGDTVLLSNYHSREEFMISGFFQSTNDTGMVIAISSAAGDKLDIQSPTRAHFSLQDPSMVQEIADSLNDKYGTTLEAQVVETDSFTNLIRTALDAIKVVIYSFSIVFALVVVYMVCSKIFIKERIDIGIYKAMGFTAASLRLQFAFRFLIVAGSGSVLGVILSFLLSNRLLNSLLRLMGITNFESDFTIASILLPVLLLCLCFFLFAYLISGRIKRVAIRDLVTE